MGPQQTAWQAESAFDALSKVSAGLTRTMATDHGAASCASATRRSGAHTESSSSRSRGSLPRRRAEWVPWLALLFFVGGVGYRRHLDRGGRTGRIRSLSLLMVIELVLPPVLIGVLSRLALPVP